jgi:hypothetical protein
VINEEILYRVNEERNILDTGKRRKENWIGHISRRNCVLKRTNEGKMGGIEVTGRRGSRGKKPLDDLKGNEEVERGSTRSHCVSLWKGLWTCRKTDCVMVIPYEH